MDRWLGAEHKCMGLGHCQACIWGGRSNEGLHVICPAPNSACDYLLGTPGSRILFTSEFSSAIMPFTEDSNMFSAMPRAGHHENTLNLTLKWNKSSWKCLLWNYREITESRAEHVMPTAGALSLCTARGKDSTPFSGTTHNIQKVPALCGLVVLGLSFTGPASVMMERLRDFGVALELGDQTLLCPCSVMLFSSGPLGKEETGLTSRMKPACCPGEAVILGSWRMDVQIKGTVSFPSVLSWRPLEIKLLFINTKGLAKGYSQLEWRLAQS